MVSPRKSLTAISQSRCEINNNNMSIPAKSCESLFSGSSRESASQIYQRKQPARGMKPSSTGGMRQPSMVPSNTNSDIHQRVMSARNLRAKTFQNQLADAQTEIANLAHENRMLRTMHKRQSMALNKYESTGAELPQLLHSHAEELRVWQTKHRNVQAVNKELEQKMKQKEAQILSLSDQNRHFSQLIKDKNLDERQKLQDKVRTLEQRLQEKDNDTKLMARKVQLETKNIRQQLLNEQKKCKEVMLKLEKARLEISGYRKLEEFSLEKANPLTPGRRNKLAPTTEEKEKIDKLEKSLEMLDKAIEKNNLSEMNGLTDVLETDSNFEFDKDDGDEDKSLHDSQDSKDLKPKRGKLTLPPANVSPPKLASINGSTRLSLSQAMQSTTNAKSKQNSRLRSTGGATISGSMSTMASVNVRGGSITSKRRDMSDSVAKLSLIEGKPKQILSKTLDFDYEDEDSEQVDYDDEMIVPDDEATEDNEDPNQTDDSPRDYAAYLDTKCELSDMLTMDEGDEDDDDDDDNDETDEGQSVKRSTNNSLKANSRVPMMKENMSNLRKLISDDYKEREIFLDTHCRPSSSSSTNQMQQRDDPSKKKRTTLPASSTSLSMTGGSSMAGSRKHALLAALKVIDDSKDED